MEKPTRVIPMRLMRDHHMEKLHYVMESFEEAYQMLPIYWHCTGDHVPANSDLTKKDVRMMHHVFLYCISPIVFKQQYMDTELNEFANIAGFLPGEKEIFDPEKHNADREEACYKMVNAAHKFMVFMFNLLKEGSLQHIAFRVFRYGKDTKMCMEESKKLCKDYFDGKINDKRLVALFAITLAVVSEVGRWDVIVDRFKFLQDNAANDCLRFAELAKDCVKKADYTSAISLYKESIRFRPYDHFTYSNLAQIYLKMKNYQFAQWCAQRAIWINHSWPKSHYRYIQALYCQGHLQKAWNLSTAVALLTENSECCFTGGPELLQDLVKQRDCLSERVKELYSLPMECESTKNHKKKRVKSNSSTTAILSFDITNKLASSVREKNDPPLDDSIGTSTASEEAVTNNMQSVPEITSINGCIDQGNIDVNVVSVTKQKPLKNVINEENLPPQLFVNNNGQVGKAKFNMQNFSKFLQEGSEALIALSYKVAYSKYSMALGMLQVKGKKALGLSELKLIVLKYCYAKTCIGKSTNEDINLGLKTLDEIINDHYTISFPLAYYGKAIGFIAQNRFKEAKVPLESLCSIIDNKIKLEVYEFPKCESKIIEESNPEKLQELVKALVTICDTPPPPNAICRHVTDDSHHRREIYFSDPGFQGFAQIICHERCYLGYHMPCWKEIKEIKKICFEKDFLGKRCFTPDCNSTISRIELFGADGVKRKTFPNEDEIKPKLKDSLPSKFPKETKKAVKAVNKKIFNLPPERSKITEQGTADRLMVHRQSDGSIEDKRNDFAVEDTRQNAVMVIKKKFSDDNIPQTDKKKQTKKPKSKEVLPFNFATTDDNRIEQLKTMKVAAEADFSYGNSSRNIQLDPEQPFALPPHVRGNVTETEKWLHESFNEKSRAKDSEFQNIFLGQCSSVVDVDDRERWLQEYFSGRSFTSNKETNWDFTRLPANDWKFEDTTHNDTFIKESAAPSSETVLHKYSDNIESPLNSHSGKNFSERNISSPQPYVEVPLDSLSNALDLALKDHSQKNTNSPENEKKQKLKRSLSLTSMCDTLPTKASDLPYSNLSVQSGSLNNNNQQIDGFSDGQDSISESSNTEDNTSNIVQKYFSNLISSKYNTKLSNVDNRGLQDYAEIRNEFGSQPKLGSNCSSVTGSKTVVNGVDASRNGYLNLEHNFKKSHDVTDNEEHCSMCTSCAQCSETIESFKENNLLMTSQCQDLKDKLVQSQNELQVTKKAAKRETDDLKEEIEKYKKLCNDSQSGFDINTKKLDTEKRKLTAEVKSLSDRINTLNFDTDKLVAEQSKLDAMVSQKHTSMEEERKLRFKAEDDVKTLKSNLEAMEANYKRVLNNENILAETVTSQDMKIKTLLGQINVLQKSFQMRPPPPIIPQMNRLGRPVQPVHYMPMPAMPGGYHPRYFVPDNYKRHMAEKIPLLPPPWVPVSFDQRSFPLGSFPPVTNIPLASPKSNGELDTENGPAVVKLTRGSSSKLPSSSDPPADVPSSPLKIPSHPLVPSGIGDGMLLPGSSLSSKMNAARTRSVESLHTERSLSSERPASGSKPPILYAAAVAMESKQSRNSSYEKLLQILHKEFPTIKKSGLSKYISKVRSKHNNSLSGKTLKDIVHEIRVVIFGDNASNGAIPKNGNRLQVANSMGLEKFDELPFSWGVPETQGSMKRFYGASDECYICYEIMAEGDLHSLSCGHAYHSECIKRWFEVDKTCPTCRIYAPLDEDYPVLL